MYGALWRHLPGPTWFKFIEAVALLAAVVFLLFEFVYPWIMENTHLVDNTVG